MEIAQQQKQWDRSLSYIRKIIFLEPENIIAHIKMLELYEALGKKNKAQNALVKLERMSHPLSPQAKLKDGQYGTIEKLKAHLAWQKIRHPFYRATLSS